MSYVLVYAQLGDEGVKRRSDERGRDASRGLAIPRGSISASQIYSKLERTYYFINIKVQKTKHVQEKQFPI